MSFPAASSPGTRTAAIACGAGETLNPEVIRWFIEHLGCPINDHYGQTEVGMVVCNHHGLSHPIHLGSAGLPVPGFGVAVVDEEAREVPPGTPGILAIDRPVHFEHEVAAWMEIPGLNECRVSCRLELPRDPFGPGEVRLRVASANSACNIGEAVAPNAIMGWTMFQPRREQWTRQRYQLALPESLRSRPQLENRALKHAFIEA